MKFLYVVLVHASTWQIMFCAKSSKYLLDEIGKLVGTMRNINDGLFFFQKSKERNDILRKIKDRPSA
jgi:hypothetical protein